MMFECASAVGLISTTRLVRTEALAACPPHNHLWSFLALRYESVIVNIYSHILGAWVFLSLPFYFLVAEVPPRLAIATWLDLAVCGTYLFGVATCFALSTAWVPFVLLISSPVGPLRRDLSSPSHSESNV